MTKKQFKKEAAKIISKIFDANNSPETILNELWLLHKKEVDIWKEKRSLKS